MTAHTSRKIIGLTGSVKAALMLLCVGKPMAARLVQRLSRDELVNLVQSAKLIKHVSRTEIDAVIEEFSALYGQGVKFVGTENEVLDLLNEIVPDGVDSLFSDVEVAGLVEEGVERVPLPQKLLEIPEHRIADFLRRENAQFACAVLDSLDRDQSSRVIEQLPREQRIEILRRMLVVPQLKAGAKVLLERIVSKELFGEDEEATKLAKKKEVAGIINSMRDDVAEKFVEDLRLVEPEQAMELDNLLFKFNELMDLDDEALATVVGEANSDDISGSLPGLEDGLKDRLLGTMSARARRMIEGELNNASNVDEEAVLQCRKRIAKVALSMIEDGRISLSKPDMAAQA